MFSLNDRHNVDKDKVFFPVEKPKSQNIPSKSGREDNAANSPTRQNWLEIDTQIAHQLQTEEQAKGQCLLRKCPTPQYANIRQNNNDFIFYDQYTSR